MKYVLFVWGILICLYNVTQPVPNSAAVLIGILITAWGLYRIIEPKGA